MLRACAIRSCCDTKTLLNFVTNGAPYSAVQLAPSVFMSSAAASKELMSQILPAGTCFSVPEADTA